MKKLLTTLTLLITLSFWVLPTHAQETATDESDTVRDRVREKLENAINRPKAYIGTATDKTDAGIQIESISGAILQISVDEEATTFASENNGSDSASFDDLAIGDFIVAMGVLMETEVLDAKRILLTDPLEEPVRSITYGNIKVLEDREMVITNLENEDITATFPRTWKGPDIDELSLGENVIVVTIPDDDGELTIRTIEKTSPTQEVEE